MKNAPPLVASRPWAWYCPAALVWATIVAAGCLCPARAQGQDIPGLAETNTIRFHEELRTRFAAGDTNVPLLRMDSFAGGHYGCSVDKTGTVRTFFTDRFQNSRSGSSLNGTNLDLLIRLIHKLPASRAGDIPLYQQLHVSGICSNQFVHHVYDLMDLPKEVRRLYEVTGASLVGAAPPAGKAP
jgi:hypothetical protein